MSDVEEQVTQQPKNVENYFWKNCVILFCWNLPAIMFLALGLSFYLSYRRDLNMLLENYIQTTCEIMNYFIEKTKPVIANYTIKFDNHILNLTGTANNLAQFAEKFPLHDKFECYYPKNYPILVFEETSLKTNFVTSMVFFVIGGIFLLLFDGILFIK